jgi:hypothetical protein
MVMDSSTRMLKTGIISAGSQYRFLDSLQLSEVFNMAIGSSMTFTLGKGLKIGNSFTPNSIAMVDVRIWFNIDFGEIEFNTFMHTPVSAWYTIVFNKATPTTFSVRGQLPSEPGLNSVTGGSYHLFISSFSILSDHLKNILASLGSGHAKAIYFGCRFKTRFRL